ncbi:YciI family protein [Actinoplanes sp. KI2]|uniref:YciI family protein n=1 Tax=Actinoplanes sp. KI2 TaxID=2983315 RepID=UPI0021D58070|nr:YciI family protein [Actinoplanes sp. KI2]MCU7725881.1 YciI family protein [Actinoplanes sp. KI2]
MEYFVYGRDRPGAQELRWRLVEEHWGFMDRFADGMIARGPTLSDDLSSATGSVHIVDLPDAAAARFFAFEEPNYLAGVYADVTVRRFANLLGRTMWEFPGRELEADRFLVLGHTRSSAGRPEQLLEGAQTERLIAFGPLFTEDGDEWVGTAVIGEFADAAAARAVLAATGLYADIEVHNWTFGGRR